MDYFVQHSYKFQKFSQFWIHGPQGYYSFQGMSAYSLYAISQYVYSNQEISLEVFERVLACKQISTVNWGNSVKIFSMNNECCIGETIPVYCSLSQDTKKILSIEKCSWKWTWVWRSWWKKKCRQAWKFISFFFFF